MRKFVPPLTVLLVITGFIALGWWLLRDAQIDVLSPGGAIAEQQRQLLIFACLLSAAVVIPVFVMLGAFAWQFRESNKKATYRPHWNSSKLLETIWWVIPIIIIVVLGVITVYTSHSLDPYKKIASSRSAIEVQVIALQWKWLFIYPDERVASLNQLVVPTGTPVHFTLTADAPMSAFWVPALGSQVYTMNSMSSQLNLIADKTGDYRGYGTNINGKGYADMTFTVHAVNKAKYASWRSTTQQSKLDLTMEAYHTLAKASVDRKERTYRLTDSGLYDKIMMMHMNSGHVMEGAR